MVYSTGKIEWYIYGDTQFFSFLPLYSKKTNKLTLNIIVRKTYPLRSFSVLCLLIGQKLKNSVNCSPLLLKLLFQLLSFCTIYSHPTLLLLGSRSIITIHTSAYGRKHTTAPTIATKEIKCFILLSSPSKN